MQTQSPPPTIAGGDDPLVEIDHLMQKLNDDEKRTADDSAQVATDRAKFATEFTHVLDQRVRPPMEAILERLRSNGGGGLIEERPDNRDNHQSHRLTLWMSLHDEITGAPRQDRHPYLQLDADVDNRMVTISEGDMWNGQGGNRSGRVGERPLAELTDSFITDEAVDILRRSVHSPTATSQTVVTEQGPQDTEKGRP